MTSPVRTLVVDDSATMRSMLTAALNADPGIKVVGVAPEPHTARQMMRELDPDVVTLDVEMPGMDGLSFLEKIMRLRPTPVVMCSSLTTRAAEVTIEALRLGAVDFVAKPTGVDDDMARVTAELCAKVKAAARSNIRQRRGATPPGPVSAGGGAFPEDRVIAMGSSTGGVDALFSILPRLPKDAPPVLVVQHMPPTFSSNLARQLDETCAMKVVEAHDCAPLAHGTVYIAPGGAHHMVLSGKMVRLIDGQRVSGHHPSVDMLFRSVAPLGRKAVGVILTGMGEDGAAGLLAMRKQGARTLGQDEESCVVYGMPRAANELGAVERELSLSAMPMAIIGACRSK
ncbi:protein-glutamate methylesterase/protein-glutamine glutaminase [Pseudoblastomonas halimionae]|uniref:Protein-glutamate methylesterase/protein-glutamine glutaminase n=1 Tax=Alteriqipengyuania halimionae TaxID=1926630 RepID=A0A6I4U359_9SPHN|nr:chemotaxis response regulator protein-glutamate methylesterase [Alteriqipengyuania halimionae]MXP10460.1 chemotaxis-specific protein-glutamate methyltransferase CheB [Alteriqipengyuania halimionae]